MNTRPLDPTRVHGLEGRGVRLVLPKEAHRLFRELCGQQDRSMSEAARQVILDWIAQQTRGGKP
jgi:hypothetical protein